MILSFLAGCQARGESHDPKSVGTDLGGTRLHSRPSCRQRGAVDPRRQRGGRAAGIARARRSRRPRARHRRVESAVGPARSGRPSFQAGRRRAADRDPRPPRDASSRIFVGASRDLVHRFDTVPYLVLHVDAAGLAAIEQSSDVVQLLEDSILRPALFDSVPLIQGDQAWAAGFDGTGTSDCRARLGRRFDASVSCRQSRRRGLLFEHGDGAQPNGLPERTRRRKLAQVRQRHARWPTASTARTWPASRRETARAPDSRSRASRRAPS